VRFRIWSPSTERAEVLLGDRRVALRRDPNGDHSGVASGVRPGDRYRLLLDDDGPFPDAWSRWQPDGVHGASALLPPPGASIRHRAVPRRAAQTTYELHIGTFTREGTYAAAGRKLRALRRLGVDTVQLMPVSEFAGLRNWGYDGAYLYAPTRAYGDPRKLRALVEAAHRVGLAIILDVVYNHLGPDGAYVHRFAPEFFDMETRTPWGGAIDYSRAAVRRTVIDAARWWIERYGFDGLRLDAVHAIQDRSPRHILADIAAAVRRGYRRAYVVAEDERNQRAVVAEHGVDAVLSDDFHHAVRVTLTGERDSYFARYTPGAAPVARAIGEGWLFQGRPGEPKGTPSSGLGADRFVFCLENHDQVGNRAHGRHLAGLVGPAAYRAASSLLLLVPERSLIFQGQEWASQTHFFYFTDHAPELGRRITAGRRREFQSFAEFREHPERIPDPQSPNTFERSKVDWSEARRSAAALRLYRELLRLRTQDPVLRRAELHTTRAWAIGEVVYVERRARGKCRLLLTALTGAAGVPPPEGRVLFHSEERRFGGSGRVVLDRPIAILVEP
jgi:maltooligosyltrehalose trehalohydrolase